MPSNKKAAPASKRHLVRALLLASGVVVLPATAASHRVVDDADTVPIPGNVSPRLSGAIDVGPTNGAIPAERMILVLRPRAGASERLERLLQEQLDPASPNYHHWLTPDEYGRAFGIADEDLNAVLAWLQRNGFAIDEVARGRNWIDFSGTVAQVEATFRIQMRDFIAGARLHHANVRDPEVPRALRDVVGGVVSLNDFSKRPRPRPSIAFTDGSDGLGPADFATIYDTAPLLAAGVDGRGQTIAVVGQTNIKLADVQQFRSFFGLPARDPVITVNGPDPGIVTDDEGEADLDVQWAGAVAPGSTVNLVVSKSTLTEDGVDLSAQYIVDHDLAPIVTYSYGACERDLGTSGLQFYAALWQQAAAQGMAVFVAAGDSGPAGCDDPTMDTVGTGPGVNGLASTPYDVCVGGTQFADASSSEYWSTSNSPGTYRTAKSYVPEQAWNESGSVSGGSGIWAGSGGPSATFAKPSWQAAPGVPSDGFRDTPDVSLNAASSVGYVAFSEYVPGSNALSLFSGTSATAQCFGGLMALVLQSLGGGRQGNPNPVFYRLASAQYGASGAAVFHDVTAGNNSVPGVTGFSAGPGYDLATGLGSVDAQVLVDRFAAAASADLAVAVGPSSVSVVAGGSASVVITTTPTGGFSASVSLTVSGLPAGVAGTFSPEGVPAPGSGVASLALVSSLSTVPGIYAAIVTASGGGLTRTAPLSVTITAVPPPAIVSFMASPPTIAPGQSSTLSWVSVDATSASIDNGVGSIPPSGSVTVSPAQNTTYTLTVVGPDGTVSAMAAVAISASVFSASRLVPIVLDMAGLGNARYTTELTLANRGVTAASAQLAYTPAASLGASGAGMASVNLPPGNQLVIPDVIAYLRGQNLAIPVGSNQGGTLLVTFSGLSSAEAAFVGARTTTPSGSGRAGLAYPGVDLQAASTGVSYLYGLRSTPDDRTNLALVNAGSSGPMTLRVTLFSGAAGDGRSYVLTPDTTLGPGQWVQIGKVLDLAGFTNGYARVERLSGTGPYVAYAVFNDNTTNDGSYVTAEAAAMPSEMRLLPVLIESASFQSELVLTNPLPVPQTAALTYVESLTPGPGAGGSLTLTFLPGEQKIIPGAIDYLRQEGVAIGPKGSIYAGALSVVFMNGTTASSGFVGARTAAPVGGTGPGEYGLFYPGIGPSVAASAEAWVYGLQQNGGNRSNLAVANLGDGGDPITFRLDVYDGDTGRLAGSTSPPALAPGGWTQINAVLQAFNVSNGYVRVVRLTGSDHFLVYGVVNDGAAPGLGTSDGSYVAGQAASTTSDLQIPLRARILPALIAFTKAAWSASVWSA